MVRATSPQSTKISPKSKSPHRFSPFVEQLETRNVFAVSVLPSSVTLAQFLATSTVRVTIQVVQAPVFVNSAAVTPTAVSPLDVPSAVRSIASGSLSSTESTATARVVVTVTTPNSVIFEVLKAPAAFALPAAATGNDQPAPPTSPSPPLPPSVVVPNPLVNFPRFLWVSDTPPVRPSNYPEMADQNQAPPANNGQAQPPANPMPVLPPLPPALNIPIPLGSLDHSEPRIVVVLADEHTAEPLEQHLEAPILPPTFEENTTPTSAFAGLAVALVGVPCTVANERQRRAYYRDRLRDHWPWVW
jgi:hypothetical protein